MIKSIELFMVLIYFFLNFIKAKLIKFIKLQKPCFISSTMLSKYLSLVLMTKCKNYFYFMRRLFQRGFESISYILLTFDLPGFKMNKKFVLI